MMQGNSPDPSQIPSTIPMAHAVISREANAIRYHHLEPSDADRADKAIIMAACKNENDNQNNHGMSL